MPARNGVSLYMLRTDRTNLRVPSTYSLTMFRQNGRTWVVNLYLTSKSEGSILR